MRLLVASTRDARSSGCGARGFTKNVSGAWTNSLARVAPGLSPPEIVIQVRALACELPSTHGIPLSRWSRAELAAQVRQSGLVASISGTTIWRWLNEDAIRPWYHRCWIFPRDPQFGERAGRILDLYERIWDQQPLKDDDFVLSADEKTSIQARCRKHQTLPPKSGSAMKVEHEYKRCGAWAYLAALDVHRAKLFGRCEPKNGIKPFDRLVADIMAQSPYREARRVFWIVDNGSAHRGQRCAARLKAKHPNLVVVNSPVHASWLNQIEIYFSILQRKALTPNDFPSLQALHERVMGFQSHYEKRAKPFEWKFTRRDLNDLIEKLRLAA
jgi:DDE superfamily endonuclease